MEMVKDASSSPMVQSEADMTQKNSENQSSPEQVSPSVIEQSSVVSSKDQSVQLSGQMDSSVQSSNSVNVGSIQQVTQSTEVKDIDDVSSQSLSKDVESVSTKSPSDLDFVDDSLEKLPEEENKDLSAALDKLDQMSDKGTLDNSEEDRQSSQSMAIQTSEPSMGSSSQMSQDVTVAHESSVSEDLKDLLSKSASHVSEDHPMISQTSELHSQDQSTRSGSSEMVSQDIQHEVSRDSNEVSELKFTKQARPTPHTTEGDIDTVITDENDRPLTEEDKDIILDELEGDKGKVDITIDHKRLDALHHINVYHYLPPKFVMANQTGFGYPGMMMPQQQPMTPGPIINIHNSTTSSGSGKGSDNMYDVGSDGKLHSVSSGAGGQAVVAAPQLPTQNWGQVVYSNTKHHVASVGTSGQVTQQTQPMPQDLSSQGTPTVFPFNRKPCTFNWTNLLPPPTSKRAPSKSTQTRASRTWTRWSCPKSSRK